MMNELRFALYSIKKNIQGSAELRTSFLMNIFGMFTNNIAFIVLWMFFAQSVGNIGGWKAIDVIGLEGFVALNLGFIFAFCGGIQKLPQYVLSGSFDRFMLSPKSVLLRVATSYMMVSALGDMAFGITAIVVYAVLLQVSLMQIFLIFLLALLGPITFFAAVVSIFSLSFVVTDNTAVVRGVFEFFFTPSMYHGGAFQGALRFIFTFLIPSLLVGTLPVEIVRDVSWGTLAIYLVIMVVWMGLALMFFHWGLRKYESANFMTFGG